MNEGIMGNVPKTNQKRTLLALHNSDKYDNRLCAQGCMGNKKITSTSVVGETKIATSGERSQDNATSGKRSQIKRCITHCRSPALRL